MEPDPFELDDDNGGVKQITTFPIQGELDELAEIDPLADRLGFDPLALTEPLPELLDEPQQPHPEIR